jgi:ribonuclease P protein component
MKDTVRIKKNNEFARVYRKGNYKPGNFLVLYILKNRFGINRIGITASKKVGNSVKRNRIRRLISENYRLKEESIKKGYDIVFLARSSDEEPDFYKIEKEMVFLLKKLDLYSSHRKKKEV